MGWWIFKQSAATAVPVPEAGKSTLFIDAADGAPKYKDDAGALHEIRGADGTGINLAGRKPTYADLPTGLTSADAGTAYTLDADNLMYVWDGTAWPASGSGMPVDGRSVLSGPADPTSADGRVGDFWINTATSVIWGPKATGGWPANGTSLIGPQGPQGAQGPQGPAGADGTDGTDGNLITALNAQAGTAYTLALIDKSANVRLSNAAAITVTIPANATVAFSINSVVYLSQGGAGAVSLVGASGVTVNNPHSTAAKGDYIAVVKVGADEWDVV